MPNLDPYTETLEEIYASANEVLKKNNLEAIPELFISDEAKENIDLLVQKSNSFLGVMNVTITSLTEKIINPSQDVRSHQVKMKNGYSGRTIDTKYIAPFLKSKGLHSMRESGWLTRSLEQDHPYDLSFPGAIRNKDVKNAFLQLLDQIQNKKLSPKNCLHYFLQLLIVKRENEKIEIKPLGKKAQYSISEIINLIDKHWKNAHKTGKSRLPVLAIYAVYQILIDEIDRFKSMSLKALESHTSSDKRSKDIGDIQVNKENTPFEGVEVKYEREITQYTVVDAFEKIKDKPVSRYYILSTKTPSDEEWVSINEKVAEISNTHGCQFIVNGLIPSLKYYLRLISNPDAFIENYTKLVISDDAVKYEDKKLWKKIIEE